MENPFPYFGTRPRGHSSADHIDHYCLGSAIQFQVITFSPPPPSVITEEARGGPWLIRNFQASAMDLTPLPPSLSTSPCISPRNIHDIDCRMTGQHFSQSSDGPYGLEIMGSGDRKMRRTIPYFCCAPTNVWGRFRYAWRMWRPAAIRILKSIGRRSVDSEDGAAEHLNLLLDSALDFGCTIPRAAYSRP